jgi:hypothetical protein
VSNTETATFTNCVMQCWDNPDFMREYRRLTGSTLGADSRAAIEKMIDAETGHTPALDAADVRAFLDFVRRYVWETFVAKMAAEMRRGGE